MTDIAPEFRAHRPALARFLSAYGQEGLPCDRCGTPIRRIAFMNRSSYFCPRCQRAPRGWRPTER